MKPIKDRIIILPLKEEKKMSNGLIMPADSGSTVKRGEVVAVGNDESLQSKPGDKILYPSHMGTKITWNDRDYLILEERVCLCIE